MMERPLIVLNWKAYLSVSEISSFFHDNAWRELLGLPYHYVICPSYPFMPIVGDHCRLLSQVSLGAQDVSSFSGGPHTGDVTALMLSELGCRYVILGHSERRSQYGEDDHLLQEKLRAVFLMKMIPIFCIGETFVQRKQGNYIDVIKRQLSSVLPHLQGHPIYIAYEPRWAIGKDEVPSVLEIEEVHDTIRRFLGTRQNIGILYGGGLNAFNTAQIRRNSHVDGLLLGRASLQPSRLLNTIGA